MVNFTTWRSLVDGAEVGAGAIPDSVVTQPNTGDRNHFDIDGFGNDFQIVSSSTAIVGNEVWEHTDTNLSNSRGSELISTGGLNDYPQRGDEFEYYTMEISSSSDNNGVRTVFGAQDASNHYGIKISKGAQPTLEKDGSELASGFSNLVAGQWYEVHVNWGSTTIEVTVHEVDNSGNRQTEVTSYSANDSEYDSGGVGWVAGGTGGGIRHNGWVTD